MSRKDNFDVAASLDFAVAEPEPHVQKSTPISSEAQSKKKKSLTFSKDDKGRTIGSQGGIIGRPSDMLKKKQIHITCTEIDLERIKKMAAETGLTIPKAFMKAMDEYLDNNGY